MKKTIRLIYPQSGRYSGNLSTHKVTGFATSHSGLTILAQLLTNQGHDVKIYDERIAPIPLKYLTEADLVGISMQTVDAIKGYTIAAQVKEKGIPVVIGGVHASLNPDEALNHADFVVRNEGEETFPELITEMDKAQPNFSKIPGLSYKINGVKNHNQPRPFIQDLDKVPFADFSLIDGWDRKLVNPLNRFVYFMQASRGCDFPCNFCSVTKAFGQRFRARSVDNVIEELKTKAHLHRQHLFFLDDSLACDTDYFKSLLDRMIVENLVPKLGWHSQMRVEAAFDNELLDLMRRSNCQAVTCGFESINPQTLKYMKKGQTPDKVRQAIRNLHRHEIMVIGFFVFGSDFDTVDTIRDTLNFVLEEGIDIAGFMPMTPFPGTPFHEEMDKQGRIVTKNWELYDVSHVVFYPELMTPLELFDGIYKCYYEFFKISHLAKRIKSNMN